MKAIAFAWVFGFLAMGLAHADTSKHVVRIACVPEAGLLHVESAYLHDSVAGDPGQWDARKAVLTQAGFHDPRSLAVSCALGGPTYVITAQQDDPSERMCGGDPAIHLTVRRDGRALLTDVVLGGSCQGLPAVKQFVVADGPRSWRGRETQVCYSSPSQDVPADDAVLCDWTSGGQAAFDARFPVDQQRVRKIVTREERR